MKFLESFSDRNPIEQQVKMWEDYIKNQYGDKISDTEFGKMVQIDDKSYFLKNKTEIVNRMFLDIISSVKGKIHEGSLRKAIKNWIDKINI